jgi:hypothetical protein
VTAPGRGGLRAARLVLVIAASLLSAGCTANDTSSGDGSTVPGAAALSEPLIATFEVAGGERFRVLLDDPADVDVARRLLAGEAAPNIPNGRIVHETGVNEGYGWSMDPADFEFAELTIEGCDGIPSDVETGVVTGDRYCPWSAIVVALDPAE